MDSLEERYDLRRFISTAPSTYLQRAITQHEKSLLCYPIFSLALKDLAKVVRRAVAESLTSSTFYSDFKEIVNECLEAFKLAHSRFNSTAVEIKYVQLLVKELEDKIQSFSDVSKRLIIIVNSIVDSIKLIPGIFSPIIKKIGSQFPILDSQDIDRLWFSFHENWQQIASSISNTQQLIQILATEYTAPSTRLGFIGHDRVLRWAQLANVAVIRTSALVNTHVEIYDNEISQLCISFLQFPSGLSNYQQKCDAATDNITARIKSSAYKLEEKLRVQFQTKEQANKIEESEQDNMEDDAAIAKAIKNEQAQEIAANQAELERLLQAAPGSIMVLAHLYEISVSTKDFMLQVPQKGWKYMKSDWFRRNLHQVVNSGVVAFTLADKNVTEIELNSRHIPKLVLEILHIILYRSRFEVAFYLPGRINAVVQKYNQCKELAAEVESYFEYLVKLINELAESCTATRSALEANLKASMSVEELSQKLTTGNISEINFDDIRNALLDSLKTLPTVRQQWRNITCFFNKLALIIKLEMHDPVESFAERVTKKADKIVMKNKKLSVYARDTLREKAMDIAQKGFQVNMISETYLHISQTHLLGPLGTLNKLLRTQDVEAVVKLRKDIKARCTLAQDDIAKNTKLRREVAYEKFRNELDSIEKQVFRNKKLWDFLHLFSR